VSRRLRIIMELLPEKGNPVVIRDSALMLPGEELASCAAELAEKMTHRLAMETEGGRTADGRG